MIRELGPTTSHYPQTLDELAEADGRTYAILLTTKKVSKLFSPQESCIIGGPAVAAYTGIFRRFKDIDLLVTQEYFDRHVRNLEGVEWTSPITCGMNISPPSLSVAGITSIYLEFMIYYRDGLPRVFLDDNRQINLASPTYPIVGNNTQILGIPLRVAPLPTIVALKKLDNRPKGKLDYQMLLQVQTT